MVNPYMKTFPNKNIEIQTLQNLRMPRVQKVPPPVENPRMKCMNCGAFGHTLKSSKCPMKTWDGAMVPLPLGFKESQNPRKLKYLWGPDPSNETERERKDRERQEKQRGALLLKFPKKPPKRRLPCWKDLAPFGNHLRRPSRPTFIHIKRRSSAKSTQTNLASVKKSDEEHVCDTAPSTEDTNILPLKEEKCQTLEVPNMPQTAFGHSGENPAFSENPADQSTKDCFHQVPQAASKVQEMGHMLNTQSLAQCSDEDKHPCVYSAAHPDSQHAELSLEATHEGNLQFPSQIIQNPQEKWQINLSQKEQKPMLEAFHDVPCSSASQIDPKGLPQVTSVGQQPLPSGAFLNFSHSFTESCYTKSNHVPVEPVRMIFTRLRTGYWSSKILEASSSHPPEKKMSPDRISPSLKHSEGSYIPLGSAKHLHKYPSSLSVEERK